MTGLDVVMPTTAGGTFSESSIARHRPRPGELRRPEPGGQRRAAAGRDPGCAPGAGAAGERHRAPAGAGGRSTPGPQGADPGARHGGRAPATSTTPTSCARAARRRYCPSGSWRPPRWAPSCGPSPSAMSASSKPSSAKRCVGHGRLVGARVGPAGDRRGLHHLCATRGRTFASGLAGRRADSCCDVGGVAPGQCSRPVPTRTCVAGDGGVRSSGEKPEGARSIRGLQARGRPDG